MSTSLIGCSIHSALCHLEATSFLNYYSVVCMTAQISSTLLLYLASSLLLLAGPLNYTQCPYRTNVRKFLLVGQHWCGPVYVSIKERHLWDRPCFSGISCFSSISCSSYWMVCRMGCEWSYNYCFMWFCFLDLFKA